MINCVEFGSLVVELLLKNVFAVDNNTKYKSMQIFESSCCHKNIPLIFLFSSSSKIKKRIKKVFWFSCCCEALSLWSLSNSVSLHHAQLFLKCKKNITLYFFIRTLFCKNRFQKLLTFLISRFQVPKYFHIHFRTMILYCKMWNFKFWKIWKALYFLSIYSKILTCFYV